jgi:ubiquinone/menaquinone biosynthesis C-methylase UbiE
VGLLLARPRANVTAVDLYQGYFGIDDNTPERLRQNARVAGVADRVDAKVGDMRRLPFADGEFDAAISVAAIDHLRRDDLTMALAEAARVVKPGGQFLVVSLNVDASDPDRDAGRPAWRRLLGQSANQERWRRMLLEAGFDVTEVGTRPATVYFLAQRR